MAYYAFNGDNSIEARQLRSALDNFRSGLAGIKRARDTMNGSTDQQIVDRFGVYAVTGGNTAIQQAQGLKAEIASDIGKLETNASQTGVLDAINQLLAVTG